MAQAIRPNIALIVDDDEDQRGLIGILLEETGFEVVEVASSAEAVDILRSSAHEVILIVAAMQLLRLADGARLAAFAQQRPWIGVLITSMNNNVRINFQTPQSSCLNRGCHSIC